MDQKEGSSLSVNAAVTKFLAMNFLSEEAICVAKSQDVSIENFNVGDPIGFDFDFHLERDGTLHEFEVSRPFDCKILRKSGLDFTCSLNTRSNSFPVIISALKACAGHEVFEFDVNCLEGVMDFNFQVDDHVYENLVQLDQFSFRLSPILGTALLGREEQFCSLLEPLTRWYDMVAKEENSDLQREVCRGLVDNFARLNSQSFKHAELLCAMDGNLVHVKRII
jgi:hypothetical protein